MVLIFRRSFISIVFSLKLLQACCDCISVQVFYIDQQDFVLIVSNADGIQKKNFAVVRGTTNKKLRLLYGFILFRVFKPHSIMVSPTIKRNKVYLWPRLFIDFHSEPDQERVLVDLDTQDDKDSSCVFIQRMWTWMPRLLNRPLSSRRPYCWMIIKSEGRRSLDSLMKPITAVDVIAPDPIPRRNRLVLCGGVISARTKSIPWKKTMRRLI